MTIMDSKTVPKGIHREKEVEEPTSMGTVVLAALIVSIIGSVCCIGTYYIFN